MMIEPGHGPTHYGPGVNIHLSGDEVATAIDAYLVSQGVHVSGARTTRENRQDYDEATPSFRVYVDPSGFVIAEGIKHEGRTGCPAPVRSEA